MGSEYRASLVTASQQPTVVLVKGDAELGARCFPFGSECSWILRFVKTVFGGAGDGPLHGWCYRLGAVDLSFGVAREYVPDFVGVVSCCLLVLWWSLSLLWFLGGRGWPHRQGGSCSKRHLVGSTVYSSDQGQPAKIRRFISESIRKSSSSASPPAKHSAMVPRHVAEYDAVVVPGSSESLWRRWSPVTFVVVEIIKERKRMITGKLFVGDFAITISLSPFLLLVCVRVCVLFGKLEMNEVTGVG
ncbi:hypothetical protein Ancab_013562 [Ancistrocladus abbreviatus]